MKKLNRTDLLEILDFMISSKSNALEVLKESSSALRIHKSNCSLNRCNWVIYNPLTGTAINPEFRNNRTTGKMKVIAPVLANRFTEGSARQLAPTVHNFNGESHCVAVTWVEATKLSIRFYKESLKSSTRTLSMV